jgi:hypothetical protein
MGAYPMDTFFSFSFTNLVNPDCLNRFMRCDFSGTTLASMKAIWRMVAYFVTIVYN